MEDCLDISDISIGKRLRERRTMLGFSPQRFANLVGISHQQLNKYENGLNRISATQLARISRLLNVEISFFLRQNALPFDIPPNTPFLAAQIAEQAETKTLVKNYITIPDPRTRAAVVELVTSISKYFTKRTS